MFKILLLLINISFAEIRYSVDSFFYLQKNEIADSTVNSLNKIFKTPNFEGHIDVRGELKWQSGGKLAIIRPRLMMSTYEIEAENLKTNENKTLLDLSDAFYEQYWTSQISTTLGLQVYQWGPAEFLNASNPLFHFNPKQKSAVYKEKGQVLVRTNYSFDKENNFIFILQPMSNNTQEWIAEDTFSSKVLLKYEKSWLSTPQYVGFVIGTEEQSNIFIGEYFNYNFTDEFSVYSDLKHARKRINYTTELSGGFYNLVRESSESDEWPTLGVFGVRWEDDFDVRLEYIYNGVGFSHDDLNKLIISAASISNPQFVRNLQRFLKPGLELLGQNYIYASYRVMDPFKLRDFNFYARSIFSLQDNSSQSQIEFDKSFKDAYSVFSNLSFVNGALDSEFRLINDWQFLLGLKWAL